MFTKQDKYIKYAYNTFASSSFTLLSHLQSTAVNYADCVSAV